MRPPSYLGQVTSLASFLSFSSVLSFRCVVSVSGRSTEGGPHIVTQQQGTNTLGFVHVTVTSAQRWLHTWKATLYFPPVPPRGGQHALSTRHKRRWTPCLLHAGPFHDLIAFLVAIFLTTQPRLKKKKNQTEKPNPFSFFKTKQKCIM